jgi:predicted aminopeptidase
MLTGAVLGTMLATAACSEISYYWQAAGGQLEILHKRRPIEEVLADPSVPEQTKSRLRLALRVQDFAATSLALPADGGARTYADLGRSYVSWLVVAAPALNLEAHTWCYPVAGCLGYRGYFDKAAADRLAAEMREQGYDVLVRPVRAYSTLGWFDDPLLNTFVQQDELDLMATLIHERAHRRLWVSGDTEFNESFATFVEQEGLRRLLEQGLHESSANLGASPDALLGRYRTVQADRERFEAIARAGRQRLAELYASALPDPDKRSRKAELLEVIRQDYQNQRSSFKLLNYDEWFGPKLNNAALAGIAQYHLRTDAFAAVFEAQGQDFGRFHAACEALGRLGHAERKAALDRLADPPRAPRDRRSAFDDPDAVHLLGVTHVAR